MRLVAATGNATVSRALSIATFVRRTRRVRHCASGGEQGWYRESLQPLVPSGGEGFLIFGGKIKVQQVSKLETGHQPRAGRRLGIQGQAILALTLKHLTREQRCTSA